MYRLINRSSRTFSTLRTAGPITSHLKTRSVVRFTGPDTLKFLQGLLTNDVTKHFSSADPKPTSYLPTPNTAYESSSPLYASLLTPQGRFLFDFFLYSQPRTELMLDRSGSRPRDAIADTEVYADVDASVLDELLATLKKYRLRSKVEIESMAESFSCWQRYGDDLTKEHEEGASVGWGGAIDQSGVSASQGNNIGWQWYSDPRLSCLGFRGIFPSNSTPPLVEADKEADERNYLMWRIENGVAEGSTEIPKGEAMPLEYNFVGLNAISFDKGCYVGQELIARTHHRGVIRKRIVPLKFLTDDGKGESKVNVHVIFGKFFKSFPKAQKCSCDFPKTVSLTEIEQEVAPRSDIINSSTRKKVGSVTTALGSRGLGLIRLEEAFKDKGALTIQGNEDVKVETIKPEWWPSEWSL